MKLLVAPTLQLVPVSTFTAPKTYQVTRPVLEVNDSSFVVQKRKRNGKFKRMLGRELKMLKLRKTRNLLRNNLKIPALINILIPIK